MAKTWKNIDYVRMISPQRIERAVHNAGKGKRQHISYLKFKDSAVKKDNLHEDLKSLTYVPTPTQTKEILDKRSNKIRTICRPTFRDQIVHHLIVQELEPYMMKFIIKHNIACVPNRGGEYGRKIIKSWAKNKRESRWVVQGDVSKYYESACPDTLMKFFKRKIRDKRVLSLIQLVIDTFHKGFPLGYYICQWFGIIYLAEFDHFVKEKLRVKNYIRYVDNIIISVRTKSTARKVLEEIQRYLKDIKLVLKETGKECSRIYRWGKTFIDFIGVRTYRNGTQTLRRTTFLRLHRSIGRIKKKGSCSLQQARSILSRLGLICKLNVYNIKSEVLVLIKYMKMKRIVSYNDKQKNQFAFS